MTSPAAPVKVTDAHRAAAHALAPTCWAHDSEKYDDAHSKNCLAIARAFAERDAAERTWCQDIIMKNACESDCLHPACRERRKQVNAIDDAAAIRALGAKP